MAHKRMFSKDIVSSDAFLDMPLSSQLLYFHIGMEADDDGFVSSPKRIMRMIGCQDDDIKVLCSKRFVIPFESGVCVIKHWRMNNFVRKDRYIPTKYTKEMASLSLNENKSYTDHPLVDQVTTNGQHSIEENRIVKKSIEETKDSYGEFKNVNLTTKEYQTFLELIGENVALRLIEELSDYIASTGKRYKSHYATLRSWARRKSQENIKSKKGKGIV